MFLTNTKNFDFIFKKKCMIDILISGVFPNMKEFSESLAFYNALNILQTDTSKDTKCFVIGDGNTPRTATLIAFMTKFNVFSIDPILSKPPKIPVDRLTCIKDRAENFVHGNTSPKDEAIIMLPHSHITGKCLEKFINTNNIQNCIIIDMPCCVERGKIFNTFPTKVYTDYSVASPRREMYVYYLKRNADEKKP